MFTEDNKVVGLNELTNHVNNGDCVAIGGGLSAREPIAVLQELIRAGIKQLELVGSAHGIDVDMLCGAGAVATCAESYVGFEQDFGMAPNYRRGCESGTIAIQDNCCYTLVQQLRAAISGMPFMPINSVRGTSFMDMHAAYKAITCPFTGSEVVLVPALKPDVAIIHAHYGDAQGNLCIEGPPVADVLFAKASKKVIATVEKIVPGERIREKGVTIPYFYVTALAEVPFGAHPTSCYPFYAYDRSHTKTYYAAAKESHRAFCENYLDVYVFDCASHDQYLEKIGGKEALDRLGSWRQDPEEWMALYA